MAEQTSWLDYVHPTYAANAARWRYALDHYTGAVLDSATIQQYLIRKATAETEEAYRERCNLADYTTHFATVADSLAGMLFQNEDDASRVFGTETDPGLGSPDDPQTEIGMLWRDADGQGTGWPTIWRQLASLLTVTDVAWMLVDSDDGEPRLRLLDPTVVTNWLQGPDGVTEVLLKESADVRTSLEQKADPVARYLRFTLTGWQRYENRKAPDGSVIAVALAGPGNEGVYRYQAPNQRPILPIFRIELPMNRPVGYLLAKKANAIFNKESERDHLLRFANFPKWQLDVRDDAEYESLVAKIKAGANVVPGKGHVFTAPETGPAEIASKVLERKVDEFYVTAFREYGDAAAQKTATEVRQDVASGAGAFLQMLKTAVDDAENQALWRIEQLLWPDQPKKWFVAKVERSNEFLPQDVAATIERTRKWAFGDAASIPIGRQGQIAAATQVAGYMGINADASEITAAVDLSNLSAAVDTLREFAIGKTAKALLAVRMLEALGAIPADAEVEMADGQKAKLRDLIMREIEDQAASADARARLDSTFLPAPGNAA